MSRSNTNTLTDKSKTIDSKNSGHASESSDCASASSHCSGVVDENLEVDRYDYFEKLNKKRK